MSVYDRGNYRTYKNRTDKQISDGCNVEQALEKLTQPLPRKKSFRHQIVTRLLSKKMKPVCTSMGIRNPIKLDLSNLKGDRQCLRN